MPLPKDYRARQGDVVLLHATVKYDADPTDTYLDVEITGRYGSIAVDLVSIAGLDHLGLKPDNRVVILSEEPKDDSPPTVWIVIALHDEKAWIKIADCDPSVTTDRLVPLRWLGRAPEPFEAEVRQIPILATR